MSALSLREIARATGGVVQGRQVLCPGPGHSRTDNSLSIRLSHQSPTGFIVYSHSGDDFREARDFVAEKLGLGPNAWKRRSDPIVYNLHDRAPVRPDLIHDNVMNDQPARIIRARALWDETTDARGTIVETYLRGRGLDLLYNIQEVIRFHPRCPWRDEAEGRTVYAPCMIALMRSITSDEPQAIHRTRLTPEGDKVGRRMLGIAAGSAVKLDADDEVTMGLAIGEGIETCLAARALGFKPVWAMASAGAIASFPVVDGIEALTLLGENDPTSDRSIDQCAERWHAAGREVTVVTPNFGSDLNDVLRGAA